ncbi:Hok/Gef family protein [Klebsiella oxytoca]|uniref:Hok/Gef family protein n=1 Tax=Klebsiella oxytoca TaxID=571 RepID=A0A6B8N0I8_KLEOX|nr:Hok/Gef family protein [Klebsiella oxytoca]
MSEGRQRTCKLKYDGYILLFTWMVRDSPCELQLRQGNIELVAFLACGIKQ